MSLYLDTTSASTSSPGLSQYHLLITMTSTVVACLELSHIVYSTGPSSPPAKKRCCSRGFSDSYYCSLDYCVAYTYKYEFVKKK